MTPSVRVERSSSEQRTAEQVGCSVVSPHRFCSFAGLDFIGSRTASSEGCGFITSHRGCLMRSRVPARADTGVRGHLLPVVASLGLSRKWSVGEAIAAASRVTGRRIVVETMDPAVYAAQGGATACGMTVRNFGVDTIYLRPTSSLAQKKQNVGHELGHIVLGHLEAPIETEDFDAHEFAIQLLGIDIPRDVAGRALARVNSMFSIPDTKPRFGTRNEFEAEVFGTLLVMKPDLRAARERPAAFRLF
ncbi:ImmA/IrrE family metallo-endopeptidase [Rhodococcus koreensis]